MTDMKSYENVKPARNGVKIHTPAFRVSWPSLYQHSTDKEGVTTGKHTITGLIDKKHPHVKEFIKMVRAAAEEAMESKWGSKRPAKLRGITWNDDTLSDTVPIFREGEVFVNDEGDIYDGYEGCIIFNAKNKNRPDVVDQKRNSITEDSNEMFGGCYARMTVTVYAYESKGGPGVSLSLGNVQKVGEGEPFGASNSSADDDFGDLEMDTASSQTAGTDDDDDGDF